MINETVVLIFKGKNHSKTIPLFGTLEIYEVTSIFIPVDIIGEAVESVARKLLGVSGPGGTNSEALQEWLLKFGYESTRLPTRVKTFVEWLTNGSPSIEEFQTC